MCITSKTKGLSLAVVLLVCSFCRADSLDVYDGTYFTISAQDMQVQTTVAGPLMNFTLVVHGLDGFLPGSFDGVMIDGVINAASGISGSLFHGGGYDSHFLYDPFSTAVVDPSLIPGYVADTDALTGLFALTADALATDWLLAEVYSSPGVSVGLDFTIGQPGTIMSEHVDISIDVLLSGDANLDRSVNLDDFIILKQNYGLDSAQWSQGDFNGDGHVNLDDFIILKQNYGTLAE